MIEIRRAMATKWRLPDIRGKNKDKINDEI